MITVPVPMLGLFFSIVANLNNLNVPPHLPMRYCKKNTSPSPVSLSVMAIGIEKGERRKEKGERRKKQ